MTETITTKVFRHSEAGMSLLAVMAIMTLIAIGLMAVAPAVQVEIQREKELEAIRRGEEIANAINQYISFYRGAKLPQSMDDLLNGLPEGMHQRQILRASAAIDPLSEDGKWKLVPPDQQTLARVAKRVQDWNNGLLPSNPSPYLDRYTVLIVNSVSGLDDSVDDPAEPEDDSGDILGADTDNTQFIGVVSQSKARSVLSYYGQENHSKWVFTPMFRGQGASRIMPNQTQNPVFGNPGQGQPGQGNPRPVN